MLQIQIQKQRKKRVSGAHYMLIYKGLSLMQSNGNMPCSKYRITNRKAVLDAMVENNFIEAVDKKKAVIDEHRGNKASKHYIIAPKGFEYMRAFERLEGLFD